MLQRGSRVTSAPFSCPEGGGHLYPVSNAFLDAVKANTRKYYWTGRITIAIATVDNIHTLLHPTFQMAVRDDIIWKNPTDGVMTEITKKSGIHRGVRHALTAEQQKAFMDYIANHPVLCIGGRFLPFCLERDAALGKGWDYDGRTSTLRKI